MPQLNNIRALSITFAISLAPVFAWSEIYQYPTKIEINLDCEVESKVLEDLTQVHSDTDSGPEGMAKATAVDLNADGVCEIFLDEAAIYEGNGNEATSILILRNGAYESISALPWAPDNWWYGEFKNGYPRIFSPSHVGHRTNPTFVTDVYYFDGTQYVSEFQSEYSHGMYMDLGLKAYNEKNYDRAEIYYLNAFRMHAERNLGDANNLAITWIKLGKLEDAKQLLLRLLQQSSDSHSQPQFPLLSTDSKQEAAAYFNLGSIAEVQRDFPAALDFYIKANTKSPTSARAEKVAELRNKLPD